MHPFNSLHALRLVSLEPGDPRQVPLLSVFYEAAFGPKNMGRYELSAEECRELVERGIAEGKLDPTTVSQPTEAMKDRLRSTTDFAISKGVFGVPSFIAEGSEGVVWGNDALEGVIGRLMEGKEDPAADAGWKEWITKVEPVPGIQRAK